VVALDGPPVAPLIGGRDCADEKLVEDEDEVETFALKLKVEEVGSDALLLPASCFIPAAGTEGLDLLFDA